MARTTTRRLGVALAAVLALATTTANTAEAATYTVTAGTPGSWSNPDDTPAGLFIDTNGKFYYQQSHSLYGANDSRRWSFYSGSRFDTATLASISNTGANANTTTLCNNSPTGVQATYAPAGSGYSQRNFCDLMGVWVDPDTGTWYGLIHNEFTPQPFGDGLHYDSIDYATSQNHGSSWTIQNHVITSPFRTVRNDTAQFPNQTYYYGDGDPRLFVDNASGYFYVFYGSRVLDKSGGGNMWLEHVARAPISQKMTPSSWQKWYNGAWQTAGVGGQESNIVPTSQSSTGYTSVNYNPTKPGTVAQQRSAGTLPSGDSPLALMNVAWDSYLGVYIGTPQNQPPGQHLPLHIYATSNLATQKWTDIGSVPANKLSASSWYRWFVDSATLTTSNTVGRTFRTYCSFFCTASSNATYVPVTIDQASQLAAKADGTASYQITAANGRQLAQGSDGASTSQSQQWNLTPTGDGFYTVTNKAAGQALGVASSGDAGRAWGAAVTPAPAHSTDVRQQWSLQPVVTDSGPTGTYRLVSRYNGLALSVTGQSLVTTPQRNWDNTSSAASGDRTPSAAQVLTFTRTATQLSASNQVQ
ncbi:RICIN domain-containing protein [Actinocrispum wychmicini]|uniref:Ricin-type beta-trefoil lectin protein n=1 Tax=Actinocrispum wychmicini TaxID=1213861 RepID=A0A4R2JXZ7_9PSEU|nr:RICIN domain-containing protein [Actinocrispum wychmicini]TCO62099.1 ricin-type beta-trefoil lectin protein [Actinocrispum wychmicini]